jgi:hypothetical protein
MSGKPPEIPAWLYALIDQCTGEGVSELLVDRAGWLDDPRDEPWVNALEEIRHRGNKDALIALLRSPNAELTPQARWFLADMLDRYDLKKPASRPRTPAYDRPPAEEKLFWGEKAVRERDRRVSVRAAISEAAITYGISESSLEAAYNERRGSTRRVKKRTRPKRS